MNIETHVHGDTHLLENLWSVLGFDHIRVNIYFTPAINSENTTRKMLSTQSHQQMRSILEKNQITNNEQSL